MTRPTPPSMEAGTADSSRATDARRSVNLLELGGWSSLRRGSLARDAIETPIQPSRPARTPPSRPAAIVVDSRASE